jgi:hypothetical protein
MTKTERLTVALTVLNLAVLGVQLATTGAARASDETGVLRGRGLELVDASGRPRGQFTVEADGAAVFRIRDAEGTIRVKLGAGNDGSGLVLLDETTEPAVHLVARRAAAPGAATTSISLSGVDGRRRVITP